MTISPDCYRTSLQKSKQKKQGVFGIIEKSEEETWSGGSTCNLMDYDDDDIQQLIEKDKSFPKNLPFLRVLH